MLGADVITIVRKNYQGWKWRNCEIVFTNLGDAQLIRLFPFLYSWSRLPSVSKQRFLCFKRKLDAHSQLFDLRFHSNHAKKRDGSIRIGPIIHSIFATLRKWIWNKCRVWKLHEISVSSLLSQFSNWNPHSRNEKNGEKWRSNKNLPFISKICNKSYATVN